MENNKRPLDSFIDECGSELRWNIVKTTFDCIITGREFRKDSIFMHQEKSLRVFFNESSDDSIFKKDASDHQLTFLTDPDIYQAYNKLKRYCVNYAHTYLGIDAAGNARRKGIDVFEINDMRDFITPQSILKCDALIGGLFAHWCHDIAEYRIFKDARDIDEILVLSSKMFFEYYKPVCERIFSIHDSPVRILRLESSDLYKQKVDEMFDRALFATAGKYLDTSKLNYMAKTGGFDRPLCTDLIKPILLSFDQDIRTVLQMVKNRETERISI